LLTTRNLAALKFDLFIYVYTCHT